MLTIRNRNQRHQQGRCTRAAQNLDAKNGHWSLLLVRGQNGTQVHGTCYKALTQRYRAQCEDSKVCLTVRLIRTLLALFVQFHPDELHNDQLKQICYRSPVGVGVGMISGSDSGFSLSLMLCNVVTVHASAVLLNAAVLSAHGCEEGAERRSGRD